MPAGEIRAAEITDFSCAHEIVERAQGFFDGCDRIETVQLKQVNVIGAETFKRTFNGADQMKTRGANIIRPVTETKSSFRGNENFVAATGDGFAENFFRQPGGINVGAVEHRQTSFEADVHEPCCFRHAGVSPRGKKIALAAEGAGAECQHRDFESRSAELSVFCLLYTSDAADEEDS